MFCFLLFFPSCTAFERGHLPRLEVRFVSSERISGMLDFYCECGKEGFVPAVRDLSSSCRIPSRVSFNRRRRQTSLSSLYEMLWWLFSRCRINIEGGNIGFVPLENQEAESCISDLARQFILKYVSKQRQLYLHMLVV